MEKNTYRPLYTDRWRGEDGRVVQVDDHISQLLLDLTMVHTLTGGRDIWQQNHITSELTCLKLRKNLKLFIKKITSFYLVFSQHLWWRWGHSAHRHWLPVLRRGRLRWASSPSVQMTQFSHVLPVSASCSLMHDCGHTAQWIQVEKVSGSPYSNLFTGGQVYVSYLKASMM